MIVGRIRVGQQAHVVVIVAVAGMARQQVHARQVRAAFCAKTPHVVGVAAAGVVLRRKIQRGRQAVALRGGGVVKAVIAIDPGAYLGPLLALPMALVAFVVRPQAHAPRRQVAHAAAQQPRHAVPHQVYFQQLVQVAHVHAALAAEIHQAGHLRYQRGLVQQRTAHMHPAPGVRHPVHRLPAAMLAHRRVQCRQVFANDLGLAVAGMAADARRAAPAPAQVGHVHVVALAGQVMRQPLAAIGIKNAPVGHHAVHHQYRLAVVQRVADALYIQGIAGGNGHEQVFFAVFHGASAAGWQ